MNLIPNTLFVLTKLFETVAIYLVMLITLPSILLGQGGSVTLQNTDDWSYQLQILVDDPEVSEIHFLPFANYDSGENVVIKRGDLKIYGHGAKVSRRAKLGVIDPGGPPLDVGLKDMWTFRTDHSPINNILIDGYLSTESHS